MVFDTAKKRKINLFLFYLLSYLINYSVSLYLLKNSSSLGKILLAQIIILLLTFFVSILILKIEEKPINPSVFGIKRENIIKSFVWAAGLSTIIPVILLFGVKLVGIEKILTMVKPSWIDSVVNTKIFLQGIILWTLSGTIAFSLWQAFPYEIIKDRSKFVIPLITILWIGLYNAPILTGKFDPIDIMFFGFLFTFLYYKFRNSIGIILAYLLNENPLWWIISKSFGLDVRITFILTLVIRSLICLISLVVLIKVLKKEFQKVI